MQKRIDVTNFGFIDFGTGGGANGRNIQFGSGDSPFGDVYMHLNHNGNVGIGTDNPTTKLDVREGSILVDAFNTSGDHGLFFRRGFTTADSNSYNLSILAYDHSGSNKDGLSINAFDGISFVTGSNTRNEKARITQAGLVGIGTVTPQTILHLHDSASTRIQITDDAMGAGAGDGVLVGLNGDDDFFMNNRESGKGIKFFTGSDDERLRIDSTGDLTLGGGKIYGEDNACLLYTSPSPRDVEESRMPSSA